MCLLEKRLFFKKKNVPQDKDQRSTWELCMFQRIKSILKFMGRKQMFINICFKTARSLKSVRGHRHADQSLSLTQLEISSSSPSKHYQQTKCLNNTQSFLYFSCSETRCPRLLPIIHTCLGKKLLEKFKTDGGLHPSA